MLYFNPSFEKQDRECFKKNETITYYGNTWDEPSGSSGTMTDNIQRNKVLVVDDEVINVELICAYLEKNYDILTAYNGKEALEKVKNDKPDIVLLDIMMPGLSGYKVCREIKQHDTTRFIPVIMITTLTGLDDKIKSIEAGADDFLTKPISELELTNRVKSLLKAKSFHDQLIKSKEKIEAQNDFKTIMSNILPFLLQYIPSGKKTEIMRGMSKQVETVIWEKYINEMPIGTKETADVSCDVMNRIGGDFSPEKIDENGFTVINRKCPWGEYGHINPVLCMLTKAIFARIGIRVYKNINIDVKKTIANGDGYCLVEGNIRKD